MEAELQEDRMSVSLAWKDFFGSSVSLAPSLISIYDRAVATTGGEAETEPVAGWYDGGRVRPGAAGAAAADVEARCVDIDRGTSSAASSSRSSSVVKRAMSSAGAMVLPGGARPEVDMKKRPLSIRSTSSNTSTVSATQRRRRKKQAVGDGVTRPEVEGDLAPVSERLTQQAASYSDELNSLTSSLLERSGSESSSGCGGGVVRLSSLLTDDDELDVDVSPSSDCSDAGGLREHRASPTTSESYVDMVVAEILHTERAYVNDLRDVIQGYMRCFVNNEATSSDVSSDISGNDIQCLFSNVEDVYNFNREFLSRLESCQSDPVFIARCFSDNNDGFSVYSDYCTNYPRSISVLTRCMQDSFVSGLLCHQQRSLQHDLPLGAYILKPVQRIFKYQLLLQNMLSHHHGNAVERDVIAEALSAMKSVTQNINELKRQHEKSVRAVEIQRLLDGWSSIDLALLGELVMEDKFKFCGCKTYRYLFLFEKGLLIAKRKEDGSFQVKASIMCCNLMLVETITKAPLNFHLVPFNNPRVQFTVQARNTEQKRSWCQQLKKSIIDNYEAVIPDKAKQLVMSLGADCVAEAEQKDAESDPRKVHRKSAGYIIDLAAVKPNRGLQRSESANSTFRNSAVLPSSYDDSADQTVSQEDNDFPVDTKKGCESILPVKDDRCEDVSNHHVQPAPVRVTEGLAPTAVAERVSDDDEEYDAMKLAAIHRRLVKTVREPAARDGYCQCQDRAVPTVAGGMVDRRPTNLPRDFRAIQRSANTSKMVPTPLRSASVDRHGDGWSGISSVKHQPISGGPAVCSRYNGSSAYRVSTPSDLAVLGGQTRTSRRRRGTPPARDGVGREVSRVADSVVTAKRLTGVTAAPHAAVDSDLASDLSDLDQDIVDDLHLTESVPGFTRSNDTLRTVASTDSIDARHQTDPAPVVLRRSSAQDQIRSGGVAGTPRSQRAGSYHGSVHHSITFSDFPSLKMMGVANRSPVGSLKNALANFAGRWSKSGRKSSRSDVTDVDEGRTGCAADHGAGIVSRIVARASCRFPKHRSKSGERGGVGPQSVAVCGGRVTVSATSLRHDDVMSSADTSMIRGNGPVRRPGDESLDTDQHHVPYIDDSESEFS